MRQLKITKSITNRESVSVEKYLHDIAKFDLISADEEVELARRIRKGDREAASKLTRGNLRFVVSVAKQYQNKGLSLPDLINEGNLGLLKAVSRYDETKGFKFISYAVWWIRQSIMQAINDDSRMVRLPNNQIMNSIKLNNFFSDFEKEHERLPSIQEASQIMDMTPEKLHSLIRGGSKHVSLDAPLNTENESGCLIDILENEDCVETDGFINKQSLSKEIDRALSQLTAREQRVIKSSFGINEPVKSLDDISEELDLTKERIRQVRNSALKQLKNTKNNTLLREFLG